MRGDEEDLPLIKAFLRQYGDIFEIPKGLPPRELLTIRY